MARPLRLEVADGIYHVTARGNEQRPIYRDETDRRRFLEVLGKTLARFRWRCLAYCLMTNHYHLLVRTPEPNLARGMRDLNGVYAQAFNRRHGRVGHLFQGRYRAVLVEADAHLPAVLAYIVRNPVRAGICESIADWPWSSHRATLGDQRPSLLAVDELLGLLAEDCGRARDLYREVVEHEAPVESIHGNGVISGSDAFLDLHLRGIEVSSEVPARQRCGRRLRLDEVLANDVESIARAYEHGYTMPAIARQLGLHPSTVSRRLSRYRAQIKT